VVGALAWAGAAAAHEGEAESTALDDVRQAIAVIVSKPGDMEVIEDKIGDALESEDQEGVDVAVVEQAKEALEGDDMAKVRDLLERAIGARPDLAGTDVRPILHVPLVTGEETGTTVVTDELPGRGGLTGGDVTVLVLVGLVALGGVLLSIWWRPADSVGELRRRATRAQGR
jgi:hypothetical protein